LGSRKCIQLPVRFLDGIVEGSNVLVYVDESEKDAIMAFVTQNAKTLSRFRRILGTVVQGVYRDELYRKENVSEKARDVTAMKFKGNRVNPRIYCKEFYRDGKKVVMIHLLEHKAQQKASDKRIKNRLESIGGYDYEI